MLVWHKGLELELELFGWPLGSASWLSLVMALERLAVSWLMMAVRVATEVHLAEVEVVRLAMASALLSCRLVATSG